jgi:hypothetical protein
MRAYWSAASPMTGRASFAELAKLVKLGLVTIMIEPSIAFRALAPDRESIQRVAAGGKDQSSG